MRLYQRLKCFRCPRKPDCDLMNALIKQYDAWVKVNQPKFDKLLKDVDELLDRFQ